MGVLIAGCIGSGSDEDSIHLYSLDTLEDQSIGEQFMEETEIDIQSTVLQAGETESRYLQEQSAGEHIADSIVALEENVATVAQEGLVSDPELPNRDAVLSDEYKQHVANLWGTDEEVVDMIVPLTSFNSCLAYNTDLVDNPPTTYEELLEPRFENELAVTAFNLSTFYAQMEDRYDEETAQQFLIDFDSQNPQYVTQSPIALLESLGQQEFSVAIDAFAEHVAFTADQEQPIDFRFPEYNWQINWNAVLLETAPNTEGTKEFLQFSASEEGQELYANGIYGGTDPFHENVEHGNDDIRQRLEERDPDTTEMSMPPEREQEIDQWIADELGVGPAA